MQYCNKVKLLTIEIKKSNLIYPIKTVNYVFPIFIYNKIIFNFKFVCTIFIDTILIA